MKQPFNNPKAIALMCGGKEAPFIFGRVEFYQRDNCVLVVADIGGLPRNDTGFYGFHIHEGTACGTNDFSESGSHYNPKGTVHPKHSGDLPPLMLCGRRAHLEVLTDRFKIADVIGRTVIIHSKPDDFNSQPSGNAGTKIACGIIKIR